MMSGSPGFRDCSPVSPDSMRGSGLGRASTNKCAGRGTASPCRPHPVAGSAPGPATTPTWAEQGFVLGPSDPHRQQVGLGTCCRPTFNLGGGRARLSLIGNTQHPTLPRPLPPTNCRPGRMSAGKVVARRSTCPCPPRPGRRHSMEQG